MIKKCKGCGIVFDAIPKNKMYHSEECHKLEILKHFLISYFLKNYTTVKNKGDIMKIVCEACGDVFEITHPKQKYHNEKCRVKIYRKNNIDVIRKSERDSKRKYRDRGIEYSRTYRKENSEKIKVREREYFIKNKEKITERRKKWSHNNKEKSREYWREYRLKNKEQLKVHQRKYVSKHRSEISKNSNTLHRIKTNKEYFIRSFFCTIALKQLTKH